ncbi:hypothetical protein EK21DRAFT_102720 [Setomelanomma holmii]|uniref:Zn(2)-C6 fungal-type domain-containing protein n=1 Tax=Setomelanomma holmii TaxID=210430 RepID=A0A9P4H4W6_9PLEO|nr:hypothetical protein EK21DRAFT_102720 [Setomelanomma holmii]
MREKKGNPSFVRTGNLFPARLRASHQDKRQNPNFRRNGKLQACEPCRKGKLRCDHMMPTCGRCAKRSKPEQCVYHPAPLTKAPTPLEANFDASSPRVNSFSTAYHSAADHMTTRDAYIPAPKRVKHAGHIPPQEVRSPMPLSPESVEDLRKPLPAVNYQANSLELDRSANFINHSAVVAENELSVGIQSLDTGAMFTAKASQMHIDRGAAPMVKLWLDGLNSTWHKTLEPGKPEELQLMSEKIWDNTLMPVSRVLNAHTTPREFCTNVTGPYLRWEVVGIIVTLVSLLAQSLKDGDPIFCSHDDAPIDRAALALRMHNASELCVQFCDDHGILNDMYLWLLYENSIAYCSMRSKGSYENSKKNASLATALISYNLHQKIVVDQRTPFFMSELRKRLFICAYDNDKYLAAFSGRPPKLTRHYCVLQIPLDLNDAQTMSQGKELEEVVNDLDGKGWNQQGKVQRSTFARLSATNALITEEILELSLGNLSRDEVHRRAAEVEIRTDESWNELPDFLRIDVGDTWTPRRTPLELLSLAIVRLNHWDHHFMLQRTLSKNVNVNPGIPNIRLLSVCTEMFDFIVLLVGNKDHFRDFQVDFVQILTKYGIPAAATLAVELLHQEQYPTSASACAYPLDRSDTIQGLSVFVACLGTIRPDASGYQSCDRARTFLKKILDTILGPGLAAVSTLQSAAGPDDPMLGAPLLQPASDGDFVRWLEGMEWDQDSWINFN